MSVSIISCMGENGEIGKDNKKIWNLKSDKLFIDELTRGKIVVMGSNTFAGLEDNMDGRTKIVLSKSHDYSVFSDCICYNDILELLIDMQAEDIYVLGGESIYREFIDFADYLYLTTVFDHCYSADCYFPYFSKSEWKKVSSYLSSFGDIQFSRNKYVRKRVK